MFEHYESIAGIQLTKAQSENTYRARSVFRIAGENY
jgi:hypothetical protein